MLHNRAAGAHVDGLAALEAKSAREAQEYVKQGLHVHGALQERTTSIGAAHVVVDIDIESKASASAFTIRRGKFRFVRVAESSVVSRRFDLGLQTLNECINGLASQRELWHVPFNESPLTQ